MLSPFIPNRILSNHNPSSTHPLIFVFCSQKKLVFKHLSGGPGQDHFVFASTNTVDFAIHESSIVGLMEKALSEEEGLHGRLSKWSVLTGCSCAEGATMPAKGKARGLWTSISTTCAQILGYPVEMAPTQISLESKR